MLRLTLSALGRVASASSASSASSTCSTPRAMTCAIRHYSSRPMEPPTTGSPGTKRTIIDLKKMHKQNEPIAMVTAYDYPSALMAEMAGMDMILVGDSLAMVALGYDSTTSITMDEMLHHCRAVSRGAKKPFLVGDMPFGSYQSSADKAVENATRFIKEGNMESVKLEGGVEMADVARRIVRAGIPVLGHIGLTPQSATALGGFRVQGKTAEAAAQLLEDAQALEDAGCYAIVVEAVPDKVAEYITQQISVPTIGIGAGPQTSGQVLVYLDMLGIFDRFVPKFCKQYAKMAPEIISALQNYTKEVKARSFPAPANCYPINDEQWNLFLKRVQHQHQQQQQPHQPGSAAPIVDADSKKPVNVHEIDPAALQALFSSKSVKQQLITTYGGQQRIISRGYSSLARTSASSTATAAPATPRNIVVLGAGAMGLVMTTLLAASPQLTVWLADAWKPVVDAVQARGVQLQGERVAQTFKAATAQAENAAVLAASSIRALHVPALAGSVVDPVSIAALQALPSSIDALVVLVKSQHTQAAARVIHHVLQQRSTKHAVVLSLQNGLGHTETLASTLAYSPNASASRSSTDAFASTIVHGVVWSGARVTDHGVVQVTAGRPDLTLPLSSSEQPSNHQEILAFLADALRYGGATVSNVPAQAATSLTWQKTMVNAVINPLTALLRVPNGQLAAVEELRAAARDIADECAAIANASGVAPTPAFADTQSPHLWSSAIIFQAAMQVAERTATNRSSMLTDVERNQVTEVDFINGALARAATKHHVRSPLNSLLTLLVNRQQS
ncbi:3-methyl-2-oxobutanoate hydroxymethyltransferase [Capsaspora owczarzaki ATCC 30864]|uniref:3-methyl-2-oxobutanoate hydroxymethyltransferase n=1 Tax=Capsaspora owczarzaki (strain ATCC 30864) TaxID=595528 RepID=A0A0D2VT44_CAPO3|nr:3-methyl-2-oxobutanoate hydroxymethyltransferase [Capsaspora owczarzaki ATCC 30864]KJE94387.1 3-methyl-2-oxobutanoate hydroxymethyltransferase [Capsaspora owczarzaki ATCC 30864]|eukprot:XP_004346717.1 3-methyl-2-oxobutanoate hydroxymethyltransferase [Capsaspora owczarzaki ATCC 30864]